MRLATAGLSVAKHRSVEALHSHLHEPLEPRELEHVLLCGPGLEHHVVREQFGLVSGVAGDRAQTFQLSIENNFV